MYLVTPKQMKLIEQAADSMGISYAKMMENAGTALAKFITELPVDLTKGVVIFCGNGNNGGDGYVTARLISQMGIPVSAVLMNGEPTTETAMQMYCELASASAQVLYLNDNIDKIFSELSEAAVIVDAVFGTGFHGELPPQIKACFSYCMRCSAVKIATDVPSGGNCETGAASENVMKCDYTVTFAAKKIGMLSSPLKELCGEIIVADIGIPKSCFADIDHPISILEASEIEEILPVRPADSHKGNFGRLLNISGAARMPGACALSTLSALRSGAGLVTVCSVKSVTSSLSSTIFEATYLPCDEDKQGFLSEKSLDEILSAAEKATAITIGCGLGVTDSTVKIVKAVIENAACPIIIDADGINCIASCIDIIKNAKASITVTPHAAELARLLGISTEEVLADRMNCAVRLSAEYGITVAAKGVPTYVVGANGSCYINSTGNPGLSRGGSGDVLTGIIGGLAAQGIPPEKAAAAGVFLHGKAADRTAEKLSMQGMLPSDVISELPLLFKDLNR